jgi:hypothetical protein
MQAASAALAATYQVTDTIVGGGFNSAFSYIAEADPTHGRVYVSSRLDIPKAVPDDINRNYVDAGTAAAQNLTFASSDSFILRADHTTVLNPNGAGRNSVRLESNKLWSTAAFVYVLLSSLSCCA